MKKILLVCAAGMSTSMLVKRMIDHANAISLEVNISALAIAEAKGKIKNNEVDVVLLGEGANKRGNSSRLTQSFHFFMFKPIFSPVNALNQPI
jgi:galactitol-specific phosphotransferase system IIB component